MNYDNPAARLHVILVEGQQQPQDKVCQKIWHRLLKTDGDDANMLARLGKVMALTREAATAMEDAFPNQHSTTTAHWVGAINRGFTNQNLAAPWKSFIEHIDAHTINYLAMAASLLQTRLQTAGVAEEELAKLRADFESILQDVLASKTLSPILRRYLVRSLRAVITTFEEYTLTGSEPIITATEAMIGRIGTDANYRSFLTDDDLGKRLNDALVAAASVVAVAVGLPQLTQALQPFLK
jgi:hypothetical protein